ncbi:MAG: hypothetical protein ABIP90_07325 [Vicinamibacterales bacterium]
MRLFSSTLLLSVFFAAPARAQTAGDAWEFGLGPQVVYRESSSSTHFGGGVTVARRLGRFAAVLEGSGTRRQGHNDWRVIGGPRLAFGAGARSAYFAHVLAGSLIRQKTAGWAVLPGVGFEARVGDTHAVRLQIDAPIEHTQDRTVNSVRASVWFVF